MTSNQAQYVMDEMLRHQRLAAFVQSDVWFYEGKEDMDMTVECAEFIIKHCK